MKSKHPLTQFAAKHQSLLLVLIGLAVLIGAFVAGELGLTMNSSTSASLPVRHLMACTSVDIVKRKMFDAVTSFLLMIVSMPIDSARLM